MQTNRDRIFLFLRLQVTKTGKHWFQED